MGFQLRLSDELDIKIKIIAQNEQRSKNKEIEYILQKYVSEYEHEHGVINTDSEGFFSDKPLR